MTNCNSINMRSGNNNFEISKLQKSLLLSLMGVFIEEVCKTALLYVKHDGRFTINTKDMLMAIKYEIMSNHGCGQELKKYIQNIQNLDENDMVKITIESFYQTTDNNTGEIIDKIILTNEEKNEEENDDNDDEEEKDINEEEDNEDKCSCPMCLEIEQLFLVEFIPEDDFDAMVMKNYNKVALKYKNE